jgi:hypothetical protein
VVAAFSRRDHLFRHHNEYVSDVACGGPSDQDSADEDGWTVSENAGR